MGDLGQARLVAGTVIQPRGKNYQYVTEYTVSTSLDGKSWKAVPGVYTGHATELKEFKFSKGTVVRARYVRLIVKSWKGHVSLRADVLIAVGTVAPGNGKVIRAGVPENKRTYSSVYNNDKIGTGHAR